MPRDFAGWSRARSFGAARLWVADRASVLGQNPPRVRGVRSARRTPGDFAQGGGPGSVPVRQVSGDWRRPRPALPSRRRSCGRSWSGSRSATLPLSPPQRRGAWVLICGWARGVDGADRGANPPLVRPGEGAARLKWRPLRLLVGFHPACRTDPCQDARTLLHAIRTHGRSGPPRPEVLHHACRSRSRSRRPTAR
jgi:hypothetical protein